jgi:hypothetical protein
MLVLCVAEAVFWHRAGVKATGKLSSCRVKEPRKTRV